MTPSNHKKTRADHYHHVIIMSMLSFASMFVLMYAMVDRFANVYVNFNQFYMAGLMTAPMVVIEIVVMRSMYHDKRLNAVIAGASTVALLTCWLLIRQQSAVGDEQFLRSMIPHHAGAILMCEKASISDSDIKELCRGIISSQQSEIDQMKARLQALER